MSYMDELTDASIIYTSPIYIYIYIYNIDTLAFFKCGVLFRSKISNRPAFQIPYEDKYFSQDFTLQLA